MDFSSVPEQVRPLLETLRNDLIDIRFRWATWKRLFRSDEATRDLLRWGAPDFFDGVYRVYLSDVCLGICRLLDPPGSGSRSNLVLDRLLTAVEEAGRPDLADQMRPLLSDANAQSAALKLWRNKYLAHRDLEHAFDEQLAQSATVVFSEVDEVLDLLGRALNVLELEYTDGTTFFGDPIDPGPDQVLGKIRDAKRWRGLPRDVRWNHRDEV